MTFQQADIAQAQVCFEPLKTSLKELKKDVQLVPYFMSNIMEVANSTLSDPKLIDDAAFQAEADLPMETLYKGLESELDSAFRMPYPNRGAIKIALNEAANALTTKTYKPSVLFDMLEKMTPKS